MKNIFFRNIFFQKKLEKSIEKLIAETTTKLYIGKSYVVIPYIEKYKQKREQIIRSGLCLDDYDERFQCLSWETVGLEKPQFEIIK